MPGQAWHVAGAFIIARRLDDRRTIRLLKVGDRVRWAATTTDFGTIVETAWNGVTIDWDDGNRSSIQHNDMARVERVPAKS